MKQILKYDILLQWRQGFWLVYSIITLVYLLIIFNVPTENRYFLSLMLIFSDTSMLGIIFIGALVLLEKQQNVQHSLWVTPLKSQNYILSKSLSLTLLSFSMSFLLLVLPNGFQVNYMWVLIAAVLSSIFFILFGIGISSRVKSLNGYIAGIMGGSLLVLVPVLPYFVYDRPFWLIFFPINAALDLVLWEQFLVHRMIINIVVLFVWIIIAYFFAVRQYKKYILT